ncbi:MAG: type II toxin-antitoxin system HicB family antitoxin [Candidatus Electrothrix sp. LOE2]|nr:type II toxin-antitoxin system HicB family antitoxin [Candidatus Electrothrix sp. LOE2]
MIYKGYSAKINFDGRDNIFRGKVIGIKDSITFEGETVDKLVEDFHNAVDHYLADCKEEGCTPHQMYSSLLLTDNILA